jgi:pre-mRNA cleavage complex 2 protein Pcf11
MTVPCCRRVLTQIKPFPNTAQYGQLPVSATPPTQVPTPQQFPPPVFSSDLETLKADLAKLIASTNPSDPVMAPKLKALRDLQTVLNTQTLPPQQLQAVRTQIQALSPPAAPGPSFPAAVSVQPQAFVQPPQQAPPPIFPPAGTPLNLAQILANVKPPVPATPTPPNPTQSLADMLRRVTSPMQQSSTPTVAAPFFPPLPFPPIPQPTATPTPVPAPAPAPAPAPTPTNNLAQLLASLNKPAAAPAPQPPVLSQLLPQQPTAAPPSGTPDWLMNALKGLPQLAPGSVPSQPTPAGTTPMGGQVSLPSSGPGTVELTTASMKQ